MRQTCPLVAKLAKEQADKLLTMGGSMSYQNDLLKMYSRARMVDIMRWEAERVCGQA